MLFLLLLAVGCRTPQTVVRYYVAGYGVAEVGDYTVTQTDFDEYLASGTNQPVTVFPTNASPYATAFHRGHMYTLVWPHAPYWNNHLSVFEDDKFVIVIREGVCDLSDLVTAKGRFVAGLPTR